jgi:hypothetical protein
MLILIFYIRDNLIVEYLFYLFKLKIIIKSFIASLKKEIIYFKFIILTKYKKYNFHVLLC